MALPAVRGLPVAGTALVGVAAASAAVRLPGTPEEVRLAVRRCPPKTPQRPAAAPC